MTQQELPERLVMSHARKVMTQVAKDAGLSRERFYRALSAEGNSSFAAVLKVARALGVKLHAEAM